MIVERERIRQMKLIEELGKRRMLTVVKTVDFGIYLGTSEERVLLPKKEVPKEIEIGDPVEVFLYKDSSDRLIATTTEPKITLGELAVLTVKDTGKIGAFLDWGLPKDLLLPFKEQTAKVKKGDQVLVALYVDKSERLCATMKVYEKLETDSPYKKVHARVIKVREDGKLDLSVREKAFIQMDADAELIVKRMEEQGGKLPFTDKADPEKIKNELGLSKNAFKRAVGRLLKENKVIITEKSIEFLHK